MQRRLTAALLVLAAAAGAAALGTAAPAARADTAVLPAGIGLPWTDPAHQSPLEQALGAIASKLAGRPVAARCEGDNDWGILAKQGGFDPNAEAGYVNTTYSPSTNRFVGSATMMELSPGVCLHLQQFAQAAVKPTTCQGTKTVTVPVTRQKVVTRTRVVTLARPTRIDGKLYSAGRHTIVTRTTVPVTASEQRQGPGDQVPCFTGTAPATPDDTSLCWRVHDTSGRLQRVCFAVAGKDGDDAYWSEFYEYAQALETVAHESVHLLRGQDGQQRPPDATVEAEAECTGMQTVDTVATMLGDTAADAHTLALYYWSIIYPEQRLIGDAYAAKRPYWSADCVPGGALDARADKTQPWP